MSFDVKAISSFPLKRRLLLVATEGDSWTYEVEDGLPSWFAVEEICSSGNVEGSTKQLMLIVREAIAAEIDGETEMRVELNIKTNRVGCERVIVPVIVRRS